MLAKLVARQREMQASDTRFAQELGIPMRTWRATRQKTRRLGRAVAGAAARRFPELADELARFLLEESGGVEVGA